MRAYRSAALTGLIVGTFTGAIALTPVGLDIEEGLGLQWLFQMRGPVESPSAVVIVNTTDLSPPKRESLDSEGPRACLERLHRSSNVRRPRCLYTHLVNRLDRWGASVIVFDIFFAKPGDQEEDEAFATAIARAGRVVLLQRLKQESIGSGNVIAESVQSPVSPFSEVAIGLGPFPMPKVPARVSQFWTFRAGAGDVATLPATALQVHALPSFERFISLVERGRPRDGSAVLQTPTEIHSAKELTRIMRWLRDGMKADRADYDRLIRALESTGMQDFSPAERVSLRALAKLYSGPDSYFLNLYGPPGTIRTIPAHAVLSADASADRNLESAIRDKVVFVGQAARSVAMQQDGHYTVFSRADGLDLSGVEIAASAYANLLNDQMLKRPNNFWILLIIVAGCILVGTGSYRRSTVIFAASTLGVTSLYVGAAAVLFVQRGLWMPVILPVVGQFVTIGVCLVLRAGFMHGPARLVYGVCLLTDIGRFTETIEKFKPKPRNMVQRLLLRIGAEEVPLMTALRKYFRLLSNITEAFGGMVLHQIGDSMVCIWQIKKPHDNSADGGKQEHRSQQVRCRVCQAALEIERRVNAFNETVSICTDEGERLKFPTRIGMDVGQFEIGHFGRTYRSELDVIGDPANTASRLEQLNKILGTEILASQSVVRGLDRRLVMRWVGTFVLSGKSEEIEAFEIQRTRDPAANGPDNFCRRFEDALRLYAEIARKSERLSAAEKRLAWSGVAEEFIPLQQECPDDGPTHFFIARAQHYSKLPPERAPWPICTDPEEPN